MDPKSEVIMINAGICSVYPRAGGKHINVAREKKPKEKEKSESNRRKCKNFRKENADPL